MDPITYLIYRLKEIQTQVQAAANDFTYWKGQLQHVMSDEDKQIFEETEMILGGAPTTFENIAESLKSTQPYRIEQGELIEKIVKGETKVIDPEITDTESGTP